MSFLPQFSALRHPALLIRSSASSTLAIRRWTSQAPNPNPNPASVAFLLDNGKAAEGANVSVNGFVRSVRAQKQHCFVALGDGSTLTPLQALVSADQAEGLATGAAVRLTGSWVESPAKGQTHELHVSRVEILGPSDPKTFPIQKKYQTPEYLRAMPHLRPRTPFNSVLLRFRSEAIASLTSFFATRQFVQTHPPVITSSDCEGAGEVFTVVSAGSKTRSQSPAESDEARQAQSQTAPTTPSTSSHDTGAAAAAATESEGDDFFRSPKYLTVSSQLHLEALAQSVGNVWTLSPTFRAEKSDTSRHLAEFYMLEAEMSFVDDMEAVMCLTEDMLKHLTRSLFPTRVGQELVHRPKHGRASDLASADEVESRWRGIMDDGKWPRITYTEAIEELKAAEASGDATFEHKPKWGQGLQSEHERFVAKAVGKGHTPVFVTNYPRDIKAFYMRQSQISNDRDTIDRVPSGTGTAAGTVPGATVECFDLLVPEYCEIAGGSMRENRLQELLDAMRSRGIVTPSLSVANGDVAASEWTPSDTSSVASGVEGGEEGNCPLGWYVDLRRWGCPPHGGFGLGFDRLLCYLSGIQSVRDCVAFPRWHGRCDC